MLARFKAHARRNTTKIVISVVKRVEWPYSELRPRSKGNYSLLHRNRTFEGPQVPQVSVRRRPRYQTCMPSDQSARHGAAICCQVLMPDAMLALTEIICFLYAIHLSTKIIRVGVFLDTFRDVNWIGILPPETNMPRCLGCASMRSIASQRGLSLPDDHLLLPKKAVSPVGRGY